MTDTVSASLCGWMMVIAGVMELLRSEKSDRLFLVSARLAALGFFLLGSRLLYLVYTQDLGRLHFLAVASMCFIALARIIACAHILKIRL